MADRGPNGSGGWKTVGYSNAHHVSKRPHNDEHGEREMRERSIIAPWEFSDHLPSPTKPLSSGSQAKSFDDRLIKQEDLGHGQFGHVDKIVLDGVRLARKRIKQSRGCSTLEELRQEGLTMRKLDFRHVVKLVAMYAPRPTQVCLLIWPAAVCTLYDLLHDIDELRSGKGDRDDILGRLQALELGRLRPHEMPDAPPDMWSILEFAHEFVRQIIGCTARALAHCHARKVRHLDIKPSNILINPRTVYLADFGISKDVSDLEHTSTEHAHGTPIWRAPELWSGQGLSMQLSDVYSLGLVYLNIATILHHVKHAEFDATIGLPRRPTWEEMLDARAAKVAAHLDKLNQQPQGFGPKATNYESMRPRPFLGVVAKMLDTDPHKRLPASKVDEELSLLGGLNGQIYHGDCCKRPISWLETRWDGKLAAMSELRTINEQQHRRIETLEGMDRIYEERLAEERRTTADLQKRLKEAQDTCRALEQENARLTGSPSGRRPWNSGLKKPLTRNRERSPSAKSHRSSASLQHTPPSQKSSIPRSSHLRDTDTATRSTVTTTLRSIQKGSPHGTQNAVPPTRISTESIRRSNRPIVPQLVRDVSSNNSSLVSSVFSRRSNREVTPSSPLSPRGGSFESKHERGPSSSASSIARNSESDGTVKPGRPAGRRTSATGAAQGHGRMAAPGPGSQKSYAQVAKD